MNIAAIISEYNPFHLGHGYHIQKTREAGATHIISLMSGNVVQRGDVAISDAHERAEKAVRGGADLVLELPPQFSLCPARDFACAGVRIISRLGCVDTLSFGAEDPDIFALSEALDSLNEKEPEIKLLMSSGKTYPQAASLVCGEKTANITLGQNNTLALEYLRAASGTGLKPLAIKRTVPHDSEITDGCFASASQIRKMLIDGEDAEDFLGYRPDTAKISYLEKGEKAILFKLSAMNREDFSDIPRLGELAPRIYLGSRRAKNLEELFFGAKSRNFTLSRVRRGVISAALGIKKSDMSPPPFVRVLALNRRGAEILKLCKSRAQIRLGGALAELSRGSKDSGRLAELIELASRFRELCSSAPSGISEYEKSAVMIERE